MSHEPAGLSPGLTLCPAALQQVNDDDDAAECVRIGKELFDALKLVNEACTTSAVDSAVVTLPTPPMNPFQHELDEAAIEAAARSVCSPIQPPQPHLHSDHGSPLRYSRCELQPMATLFGGIAAQEVFKSTGQFKPLNQWLFLDAMASLPKQRYGGRLRVRRFDAHTHCCCAFVHGSRPTDTKVTVPGFERYKHQIAVFGEAFQLRLAACSTFMVGCGAIGCAKRHTSPARAQSSTADTLCCGRCEQLKNFAMIGVACRPEGGGATDVAVGTITVTDDDVVEEGNLSRQLLFRSSDVGLAKTSTARAAAVAMNEGMNVAALTHRVEPRTEPVFDDAFWRKQHWITGALDNVAARRYTDRQCRAYGLPLLEASTQGTQGNTSTHIPHVTNTYSDLPAPQEGQKIPFCSVHHYPTSMEHCCEWARTKFEDLFVTVLHDANDFLTAPDREQWCSHVSARLLVVAVLVVALTTTPYPHFHATRLLTRLPR